MKKRFFYFLVASMLLAGCGNKGPENLIPSDFIEKLDGQYFSVEGSLNVLGDTVKFNDLELKATKFQVEQFDESFGEETKAVDHAVTYLKNGKEKYRLYFKGENGFYQLHLEKETKDGYDSVATFMPSIEEFTGAYTGMGDSNEYNVVYHIGNDFDFYRGYFNIGKYIKGLDMLNDTEYVESFVTFDESGMQKVISICDYADNYEYYKVKLGTIDNQTGLLDVEYDSYLAFYHDPMYLTYPFYSNEGSLSASVINPSEKSVTIGDVTYSYENAADEKGQVVTLTNGSSSIETRPTQYGMTWSKDGNVIEYTFDSVMYLLGDYQYKNSLYSLTMNDDLTDYVLNIDGQEKEFTYAVFNHRKAIKVSMDNKDVYFTPFKTSIAIMASDDKENKFYINEQAFLTIYNDSFVSKSYDDYETLSIDSEFKVSYKSETAQGYLIYNPALEYPYLEFTLANKNYVLTILEAGTGIAQLTEGNNSKDFFVENSVTELYHSYTSHHETEVVINKDSLTYYGEENVKYELEAYYSTFSYSYVMAINFQSESKGSKCQAFANKGLIAVDETKGHLFAQTTVYIDVDYFADLVGEYYLDGTFGPEKFVLTSDGHFYADTLNSTNDGLIKDVEYEYSLKMTYDLYGGAYPTIVFYRDGGQSLDLVKQNNALVVGGTLPYVVDYLFDYNGIYTLDNSVIELRGNALYVDGTQATISEVTAHDDGSTSIKASVGFLSYTYTFNQDDEGKYVVSDSDANNKYRQSSFDFDSLVGEYTVTSGTYTISFDYYLGTGIVSGYLLTDGVSKVSTYSVVFYEGHLALKFSLGFNTVYVYASETGNVLEVVSASLPPVPPPPPPLPLF